MQLYDGDWSDNNDKVWQTMKAKGISQYDQYNIFDDSPRHAKDINLILQNQVKKRKYNLER